MIPVGLRQKKYPLAAIVALVAAIAALLFYAEVDPESTRLMPRCVFRAATGFDCPGCGFQRALHAALHGDFALAWGYNPFLFFMLPVGLLYFIVELFAGKDSGVRRMLLSPAAIITLLLLTVGWWVARNL